MLNKLGLSCAKLSFADVYQPPYSAAIGAADILWEVVEEDTISAVIPVQDALDIFLILADSLSEVTVSEEGKKWESSLGWSKGAFKYYISVFGGDGGSEPKCWHCWHFKGKGWKSWNTRWPRNTLLMLITWNDPKHQMTKWPDTFAKKLPNDQKYQITMWPFIIEISSNFKVT